MKLLHIDSSQLGSFSVSRALSRKTVMEWAAHHNETLVEYLDLAHVALSHLGPDSLAFGLGVDSLELTPAQKRENQWTEKLLCQFLRADVLVIGAPMYNFTIPTQLKAWIDRITQPGRTFLYTAAGSKGLVNNKIVIVVSTRGGMYSGLLDRKLDHQESYLLAVFRFVGITDVRFVRAEGLAMGEQAEADALASAEKDIRAHTWQAQS